MIPQRFVTEYPARCGQLLEMLEPLVRERDLIGSFALLVASAAFTIPFARMREQNHPLGPPEGGLYKAIKQLGSRPFLEAPFWNATKPRLFGFAKIVGDPQRTAYWKNDAGNHPFHAQDQNKDGRTVLRTMRNALAHGNVVYLDENGHETPGHQLRYLAFLSKNLAEQCHDVVIFGEEDFLLFLKAWIAWVQAFPPEHNFAFPEAAE